MQISPVERVRSFNRMVTARVGALNESYLGRGRSLGEARFLFEIGDCGRPVGELRTLLGLDSGYASRLLRSLDAQGLIELRADPKDRRRRLVTLTDKGRRERAEYDRLSHDLAQSLLENLDDGQQQRLVSAMSEVERILVTAQLSISTEAPDSDAARHCLSAYFNELAVRFEDGFDPEHGGLAIDPSLTPPEGGFLVARLHDRPVACGAVKRIDNETAEIKRMWVDASVRGYGIARRLLSALEGHARELGYGRVVLDTNKALTQAQALYLSSGYTRIPRYNDNPYAHHWFGKTLGQA